MTLPRNRLVPGPVGVSLSGHGQPRLFNLCVLSRTWRALAATVTLAAGQCKIVNSLAAPRPAGGDRGPVTCPVQCPPMIRVLSHLNPAASPSGPPAVLHLHWQPQGTVQLPAGPAVEGLKLLRAEPEKQTVTRQDGETRFLMQDRGIFSGSLECIDKISFYHL